MAEEQDNDSKTEEPSAKKLADARERGQFARSQELNHLFVLGAATSSNWRAKVTEARNLQRYASLKI